MRRIGIRAAASGDAEAVPQHCARLLGVWSSSQNNNNNNNAWCEDFDDGNQNNNNKNNNNCVRAVRGFAQGRAEAARRRRASSAIFVFGAFKNSVRIRSVFYE